MGFEGLLTHSSSARAASAGSIALRSMPPSAAAGTGTARQPAKVAPISYVGYETAGYSTVSRAGVRNRK